MDIHTSNAQPAICLRLETKLSTLTADVGELPMQLLQTLEKAQLTQTGPMVFVYRDMSDDLQAPFKLEIAVPVADTSGFSGNAEITTLGPLRYAETVHRGDLRQLGETYQRFFPELAAAGLTPAGETREVYTEFVDSQNEKNITHIQVGV
ncbi:MAG: GyrI-like domain-containing protein [Granulosicoccaceae bacterium]